MLLSYSVILHLSVASMYPCFLHLVFWDLGMLLEMQQTTTFLFYLIN